MKKNKAMRAAGILFVAAMLSTSIVSGTYAKYVTEGSASDSARVAKFGVTVTGTGSLFDKTYYNVGETNGNQPAGETEDNPISKITVKSSTEENVVAPGTKSDETNPFTITVTGSPEVDVLVTLAIEDGFKDVYLKAGTYTDRTTQATGDRFEIADDYYPIVYTIKDNVGTTVAEDTSLAGLQTKLRDYAVYCNAGELQNVSYTLSWKWDFGDPNRNQADTLLGDLAARDYGDFEFAEDEVNIPGADYYNLETSVELTVTVAQVD